MGFVMLMRSDKTKALMGNPHAFTLASIIAWRAQRTNSFNLHDLEPGEALLGDYSTYGMSERQYRTAKQKLATWGIATFQATNRGTIAKLVDDQVYDINREPSDNQYDNWVTGRRQARNDYQEGKNGRKQEQKRDVRDKRTRTENQPSRRPVYRRDYQAGDSEFGQTIEA